MALFNRRMQENVMNRIKIKDYQKVYNQYIMNDQELIDFIVVRNKDYPKRKHLQYGGTEKTIRYKYDGKEFILHEAKSEDGYDISMRRKDDPDEQECLHVMTDTARHIAYIANISYYPDCVRTGLDKPGGGTVLLKMCLQFLKATKDRYKIKRIQLKDNSHYICKSNKKNIHLPLLHTFIFGNTWYSKYGFRPYDPDGDTENKRLMRDVIKNEHIVNNTKLKDTPIFRYLKKIIRKKSKGNLKEEKQMIKDMHEFDNLSLRVFFRHHFFEDFQETCETLYDFYEDFAKDIDLYDFYGKPFYLDI